MLPLLNLLVSEPMLRMHSRDFGQSKTFHMGVHFTAMQEFTQQFPIIHDNFPLNFISYSVNKYVLKFKLRWHCRSIDLFGYLK